MSTMKRIEYLSRDPECIIVLLYYDDDACSWIVRTYRKVFFWKKRISSYWFCDEAQARLFAKKLKAESSRSRSFT